METNFVSNSFHNISLSVDRGRGVQIRNVYISAKLDRKVGDGERVWRREIETKGTCERM